MTTATDTRLHPLREYPADLLKFIAWPKPLDTYEAAVNLIISKKPVLGEPVVVPFYFTHADGSKTLELVFGIGSLDPEHPYIKCSITNDVLNEAVIKEIDPNTGEPVYVTLEVLLNQFMTKEQAAATIDNEITTALSNPTVINNIAEQVVNTTALNEKLDARLSWKPLSDLITTV